MFYSLLKLDIRMHVRDNMKVLGQASGKKISKKNLDKLTQHWRTKSRSKASKKVGLLFPEFAPSKSNNAVKTGEK